MIPVVRPLDPVADRALAAALFADAADYVALERGEAMTPALADALAREFFTDAPPGADPASSLRLGLVHPAGRLLGLADLAFGYPSPGDAFLGLMILAPDARAGGLGAAFLAQAEALARARGAGMLYAAVLDANPRGRAFWRRQGFAVIRPFRPVTLGPKAQFASRIGKGIS
jgi:GNAT superfamily N-acetyltransferase